MEIAYLFNGFCQMTPPRVEAMLALVDAFVTRAAASAAPERANDPAFIAECAALPVPDMLARAAMGLGKNGVPNRDRCAVAALCRGAALQALGRSSEARQCFEWIVAKSTRITKDR